MTVDTDIDEITTETATNRRFRTLEIAGVEGTLLYRRFYGLALAIRMLSSIC